MSSLLLKKRKEIKAIDELEIRISLNQSEGGDRIEFASRMNVNINQIIDLIENRKN